MALDHLYLTREYDLCLDGHEWSGLMSDNDGVYKMCLVCDIENGA
jgi:hypothetical protein